LVTTEHIILAAADAANPESERKRIERIISVEVRYREHDLVDARRSGDPAKE
jgi:hypothetical protein